MQYNSLRSEYENWCEEEDTRPKRIGLNDLDVDQLEPGTKETTKGDTTKESVKSKKESNTIMNKGNVMVHNMTSLSKYWDEIMINKNMHVPVSIFCPKWLLQDLAFMRHEFRLSNCS